MSEIIEPEVLTALAALGIRRGVGWRALDARRARQARGPKGPLRERPFSDASSI